MKFGFAYLKRFGASHPDNSMRVINERGARAGAGLLFAFAMVSFLNSFLVGNFVLTKLFVVVFFIDFLSRVLVHPRYAPSLILGVGLYATKCLNMWAHHKNSLLGRLA